jgi:hypothetical protein
MALHVTERWKEDLVSFSGDDTRLISHTRVPLDACFLTHNETVGILKLLEDSTIPGAELPCRNPNCEAVSFLQVFKSHYMFRPIWPSSGVKCPMCWWC